MSYLYSRPVAKQIRTFPNPDQINFRSNNHNKETPFYFVKNVKVHYGKKILFKSRFQDLIDMKEKFVGSTKKRKF